MVLKRAGRRIEEGRKRGVFYKRICQLKSERTHVLSKTKKVCTFAIGIGREHGWHLK